MALTRWKKLNESIVHKNPWWTYKKDEFDIPGVRAGEYHYVHTNGASMIVPILDDGRVVMVKQYRYLCDRESVEFPCGSVKDGHSYDQTATLELQEETGYRAGRMIPAGEFNPYNGITDEICRVYIARALTQVGGTPDETEEFELLSLTSMEIDSMIKGGTLWDGMSLAAWMLVKSALL
jgi:ADP-ribose pyrophosphatase